MAFVFGILSVCCLIYYGIIAIYSGIETSFSAIWLILSFCLAVMGAVTWFFPRFRQMRGPGLLGTASCSHHRQ